MNITEAEHRNQRNCLVPTFSAQIPKELKNVLNITWTLKQFDAVTVTYPNSTYKYAPNVANINDGEYTVMATMYYNTSSGDVQMGTASVNKTANCSVCTLEESNDNNNNCRFTIGLIFENHNQNIENGTTVSIPRMGQSTIRLIDRDSLNGDQQIPELSVHWLYPPESYRTQSMGHNISIGQANYDRELIIYPTDPVVGMNPNATIEIKCQYTLRSRDPAIITFNIQFPPGTSLPHVMD